MGSLSGLVALEHRIPAASPGRPFLEVSLLSARVWRGVFNVFLSLCSEGRISLGVGEGQTTREALILASEKTLAVDGGAI